MINILAVDDIEANLYSLESLFKDNAIIYKELEDINILKALSGEEALRIAMSHEVDMIILDIQMPEMDGFEVAKFLSLNSKTKDIPIVFLTAIFKEEEFQKKGFDLGAIDYFTKPLKKYSFISKIKLYIKLFKKQKSLEIALKSEQKLRLENQQILQELQSISKLLGDEIDSTHKNERIINQIDTQRQQTTDQKERIINIKKKLAFQKEALKIQNEAIRNYHKNK